MSISVIGFSSLFILSLTLYLYSNFKLIHQFTRVSSSEPSEGSSVEPAKRQQTTFRLLWIRMISPLLGLVSVAWGLLWVICQYGLFSKQMGFFLLGLLGVSFILKHLLSKALVQLLQKLYPKKR